MAQITLREVTIGFRGPSLLDNVTCHIESGQRIGLLGRNGAGKTTLLRLLMGELEPDGGEVAVAAGVRLASLPQQIPRNVSGTISEVVSAAFHGQDVEDKWTIQQRVEQMLSRMDLDGSVQFDTLSSGMKRRVLLAQTLVTTPDVLLLDEPTNHLDIESIRWLEHFLSGWKGTLIFVTHDRMFLRQIANRILEIDRGQLFDWSCDYNSFLARKEAALEAEAKQNALFDKQLAAEEAWIRQGIKARRTRNEGRVRALKAMRQQRAERRSTSARMQLEIDSGPRSGMLVAAVEHVSFRYDDQDIVRDFSTTIMRGDKIGIVGPNGAGKTTLLRILLGQLAPQTGNVRLGTNLQIAYFDQLRDQLNEDLTVQDNVGDGYTTVGSGSATQHVIGYLQNFLFSPERSRTQVRFLSGGERNRVLLAKLFAKPANVIVLDEPTNDLDTETLELLEAKLVDYQGTVLVVSHDREFLNNVVTSTIVFDAGTVREFVGGYDDWLRQRNAADAETKSVSDSSPTANKTRPQPNPKQRADRDQSAVRRLTYKERQELSALPNLIEQLESEVTDLHDVMAEPTFYQQSGDQIDENTTRLKTLESQLSNAYQRWEELEALA